LVVYTIVLNSAFHHNMLTPSYYSTISKDYFLKHYLLVFIIKTDFVPCEVAAEILCVMYTDVNPQKNKLSIPSIKLILRLHNISVL